MRLLLFISCLFTSLFSIPAAGNEAPPDLPSIRSAPILDGLLNEPFWDSAMLFTNFKTIQPDFGATPSEKTEFFLTYSQTHLYAAFRCYDSEPGKIRATMAKRDAVGEDDWVAFCLDSFNDESTAFFFLVNPLGIQMDGTLDANASPDIILDMIWESAGKQTAEGYTVEMSIPFSSLRFPAKEALTMGFKVARNISRKSEEADFPEYSPERGAALAQFQKIQLANIQSSRRLEIMPAFTYQKRAQRQDGQMSAQQAEPAFSLNTKIGLGSNLTLDATYNPDFSQVETDVSQIDYNLRAALFYPERRPFFLEGQQWYGIAAAGENAPLQQAINTRSIADPRLGLKLSGKLGQKNILSALYALDEYQPDTSLDKNTHSGLLRYARNINQDTYIGALGTFKHNRDAYNYVAGADGRWRLDARQHLEFHAFSSFSQSPGINKATMGQALSASYFFRSRHWNLNAGLQQISKDFSTEMGYLSRRGLTRIPVYGEYIFYFQDQALQRIAPYYWSQHIRDRESELWEHFNILGVNFGLTRQSGMNISVWLADEIFSGRRFNRNAFRFAVESRPIKQLGLEAGLRFGNYIFYDPEAPYSGYGKQLSIGIDFQPLSFLQSLLNFNYVDFKRRADDAHVYDYAILRNRTTLQINRYLFIRGIAEYNTFRKTLALNFLVSFTYIPGTVCYLGYGSQYEQLAWQNNAYISGDKLMGMEKNIFFKFSYLFQVN